MRTLELISVAWLLLVLGAVAKKGSAEKPDCRETCGNLTMEFPFGMNEDCYLHENGEGFKVRCPEGVPTLAAAAAAGPNDNHTLDSHTFTILQFRPPNQVVLQTSEIMAVDCHESMDTASKPNTYNFSVQLQLPNPFMVSAPANRFRALGCDTKADINNTGQSFMSRCETQWMQSSGSGGTRYGGLGQCQIAVPEGSSGYTYNVTNQFNYSISACSRACSYAFLAQEEYQIVAEVLDNYFNETTKEVNESITFPLVAEWVITDGRCNEKSNTSTTCGENAKCNYTFSRSGYNCHCEEGSTGNPYLSGSAGCRTHKGPRLLPAFVIGGGFVAAVTLAASSYSYGSWARKKLVMKLASKVLRQIANTPDDLSPDAAVEGDMGNDLDPPTFDDAGPDSNPDDLNPDGKPKDFNEQDLKKAIKLYQKGRRVVRLVRRVMVARANLPKQGAVEIRKYTVQDIGQVEKFVIGVRTLSRTVIHPNVARLLGISTRERSLIYRYFSDKSLHDRLHKNRTDRPSWEERLKIAVGAARGLAFAHSKGVYHGNVKSSSILLDERCNCKVVDFGVARLWRKTKLLNSSKGYVDPEYLKQDDNQLRLTWMMDVYSFGVVLVELITGQDPSAKVFNQRRGSLVMKFMLAMEESRLQEMADNKMWAEERRMQLQGVAEIAQKCLQQEVKGSPKIEMLTVLREVLKVAPQLAPQVRRATGSIPALQNRRAAGANPVAGQNNQTQGQDDNDKMQGQDNNDEKQDEDDFEAGFETGEKFQGDVSKMAAEDDEEDE